MIWSEGPTVTVPYYDGTTDKPNGTTEEPTHWLLRPGGESVLVPVDLEWKEEDLEPALLLRSPGGEFCVVRPGARRPRGWKVANGDLRTACVLIDG